MNFRRRVHVSIRLPYVLSRVCWYRLRRRRDKRACSFALVLFTPFVYCQLGRNWQWKVQSSTDGSVTIQNVPAGLYLAPRFGEIQPDAAIVIERAPFKWNLESQGGSHMIHPAENKDFSIGAYQPGTGDSPLVTTLVHAGKPWQFAPVHQLLKSG